MQTVAAKLLA